jgi:hypothetical protein
MRRLVILGSVVMIAVSSVNCVNSPDQSSGSLLSPSIGDTNARGGNKPGPGTGTGGGGGTIAWVMVIDKNGDRVPSFTDTVTFAVQTTATAFPFVTLKCSQNGTLVSQESNGMFPTSLGQNFTLGPTGAWKGGTADCTATLENWDSYTKHGTITVLASTSFTTN